MTEQEPDTHASRSTTDQQSHKVVDRLVFAALTEQRRARRWRVFFMLFFVGYLSVVTVILLGDRAGDAASVADGEKHTALVTLNGLIAPGQGGGADNIIEGLRAAFEHDDTAGIVLEINSQGGLPVQAADIYDEIRRLRQDNPDIPLYAVIGDSAFSGGYFVAAAADRIYANKSSLLGSIGVRMGSFGFVDLMQKVGVERRLLTAGENKGLLDPFSPPDPEVNAHIQSMLQEVHTHFIDAVKQGRGDRLAQDDELFSGLIWSGERALALGLIDDFGNRRSVAREFEAEEIVDFTPKPGLLSRIASQVGSSAGQRIGEMLFGGPALR